jgi:hypothetical protein
MGVYFAIPNQAFYKIQKCIDLSKLHDIYLMLCLNKERARIYYVVTKCSIYIRQKYIHKSDYKACILKCIKVS